MAKAKKAVTQVVAPKPVAKPVVVNTNTTMDFKGGKQFTNKKNGS